MKRLLLLILTVAIALSCFASCSYLNFGSSGNDQSTDNLKVYFISPEDEESTTYTVTQTDENGLKLEVTLHGYKSESLGKEFYVKSNEYCLADVKLTNESDTPVYQFLPTSCRDCTPAHNHEISFDIANGDYKLNSSSFGFTCAEMTTTWTIEPGESYEWQLKLAAAEPQASSIDNKDEKEEGEKEEITNKSTASSDGYIYYDSAFVQGGLFETYTAVNGNSAVESYTVSNGNGSFNAYYTDMTGNIFFGSGFGSDGSSYYFTVIGGSAISLVGILPADGENALGLRLYDSSIFPDNVCTFEGDLSFYYMNSNDGADNDLSVSVPLSIEVVYVSSIPNSNFSK